MASFRAFKLAVLLSALWLASWPVCAQVTVTVNASSSAPGFSPTNALDQNPATFWSSAAHSTANATERLRLDFGETLPLAGARLHPRFDGATALGFPVDFRLEYTTNTAAWTTVPGFNFTSYPAPTGIVTLSFSNQVYGRYLRVTATKLGQDNLGNYYFQLVEFEPVFGSVTRVLDLGGVSPLAGVRITPRFGQTNYCYPVDYRFEYSYDEAGEHWFLLNGAVFTNQPEPTAAVTNSFEARVLARRVRVIATRLGPANCNYDYFQAIQIEPLTGDTVFPFATSKGEYYDAQLNMLWAVFGDSRDAPGGNGAATESMGGNPSWHEWMGLKYGWSASTSDQLDFLRNERIKLWPQSADGYIWSWYNWEKWPTGGGSYHQDNNAKYILGAWRTWCWTRDDNFFYQPDWDSTAPAPRPDVSQGRTVQQKLREAMRYLEEGLQGNLGGIQIEDNGMGNTGRPDSHSANYWDNWPFGYFDAANNVYYYAALEAMAQLEFYWGNYRRAAQLRQWRDGCRQEYFARFWDATKGRFIACIDQDGTHRDFGGTFHNLEALAYGLGDASKAGAVFDWLDGARSVPGDTSTGADIYAWKFAPRSNTRKIESIGPPYWWFSLNGAITVDPGTGNAQWPMHCENGGAIFYTSYYDLMARLRWRGADNALARLNVILDEFKLDQLRRDPNAWQLGIIGEFPESGLVPCFLVYGFAGIEPDLDGLHVCPRLPSTWEYLTVRNVRWVNRDLTITVRTNQIQVANATNSQGAVYLGTNAVAPGAQTTVNIPPGGGVLLTRVAQAPASPAHLEIEMQQGLPAIRLEGTATARYQLETAPAVAESTWTVLTNLLLPASPWWFLDTTTTNSGTRFYRAVGYP